MTVLSRDNQAALVIYYNCINRDESFGLSSEGLFASKKTKGINTMPRAPKKPCKYPGCPNLTYDDYCEEHRKVARRQYDKYERDPDVKKKYGYSWQKIRNRYIKMHPLCEMCLEEGKSTLAEEVHHIVPVNRGGTHDTINLMSLCRSHHNAIHHELGDR